LCTSVCLSLVAVWSKLTFDTKTASSRSATFCPRHLETPDPKLSSRTSVIFARLSGWASPSFWLVIHRDGSYSSALAPNTSRSLIAAPKHMLYSRSAEGSSGSHGREPLPNKRAAWDFVLRIAFGRRDLFSKVKRWRTEPQRLISQCREPLIFFPFQRRSETTGELLFDIVLCTSRL